MSKPEPPTPLRPNQIKRRHARMTARAKEWIEANLGGTEPRQCTMCGYEGLFAPFRNLIDARCPSCNSRPHHRLFLLWLNEMKPIKASDKLLHFAPEWGLRPILQELAEDYTSCDIGERGDLTINIEAIDLPDNSYDVIIAHQVIEHVDDAKALAELYRILKPGGFSLLTTPVIEGWDETYENPSITTRRGRILHFGQGDHNRYYGRDFRDRIRAAQFELSEYTAVEPFVARHALERGGKLSSAPSLEEAIMAEGEGAQELVFQTTTKDSAEHRTWFRGEHTHFNPIEAQMIGANAVPEFVLKGWAPDKPLITPQTQITAFGSCFAANISNWLANRNFRVLNKAEDAKRAYVVACGEGMVNSFVIRQQFEWAWEGKVFDQPLWHGYKAEDYGYDPAVQEETKRIFDETDLFILTFGLSEVWYDEPTGNVFWRTIPKDVYDESRHKFRVSTVEENRENLRAIYDLIRKHRPDARIIFTLSPIPLIATFRDNSCISSNSVSKAVLRVAIDEVMREKADEGMLYYWPSYEIITDVFKYPYRPDRRHPKDPTLDYIMTLFEHVWCEEGDEPKPSLREAWVKACIAAGFLPPTLGRAIAKRRPRMIRQAILGETFSPDAAIDKATKQLLRELRNEWVEPQPPKDSAE